ncbi:MAG: UDP-3-O-(3-hydroxymyristoyl)glucosamine N-acyltransferase [Nitrospirae bacterium]|nr:MAG: UDP-3-O-(3-hydroxymyristoyl)glucosamine N-acyltransferase [Nitrospirota bacterium]
MRSMALSPTQRLRLDAISEAVGGRLIGQPDLLIIGASSLEQAGSGELTYVEGDKHLKAALTSQAAAFVVVRPLPELARPQIVVPSPKYAFARILQRFFVAPYQPRGIAEQVCRGRDVQIGPDASIWPFVTLGHRAKIGSRVTLYPGVFVGDDSVVGDDSILYPNVTLREGCCIGKRVIVHSGTVIGSDGFGYVLHEGRHHKIPQLGGVTIEDDVELGANVTVDRATFGQTLVKRGAKVDNLVQIAHNVTIGEDTILVAQVGIAGSTVLGHHVIVGGQAGLADHIEIGDQVLIAARSGVNRSLTSNQIVSGAPVMPHETAIKAQAVIPRLPELRQQVRDLEQRVRSLESAKPTNKKARGKIKK